jgi:magnesium-transporting ATPase (P-type)
VNTLAALEDFAKVGLRTLTFAMKELSESDVDGIIDIVDPAPFESDLDLLGVTGIEDLLQDDVQDCLVDFRQAKCKVWMLTGDKGTTAKAVGKSCGLIDENMTIYKLNDSNTLDELEREIDQLQA